MKRIISAVIIPLLSVIAAIAGGYTLESLPNVQLQDERHHVSNPDNVLTDDTEAAINSSLKALRDSTGIEFAVVAVKSIDTDDYNQFSIDLFNHWGLGQEGENNGLLFIIGTEDHQYCIRTGEGLEGVLPDAICNRVGRQVLVPLLKEDKIDEGVLAAVGKLKELLTDPDALEEYRAAESNDDDEIYDWLMKWGYVGVALLLLMLCVLIYTYKRVIKTEKHTLVQYKKFEDWGSYIAVVGVVGMGIPLLLYPLLLLIRRNIRNRKRVCPKCGQRMRKLSETDDNKYLNQVQDLEEQIKSVDYDVWLCNACGATDILAYIKKSSKHTNCPHCNARTGGFLSNTILRNPTRTHTGNGVKKYQCIKCKRIIKEPYNIPKIESSSGMGSSGGSSSGGSWGGGFTSGGGAGGSW